VGLAVDNTAEATAAGALYSDAAGKFAVLAKTTRNATIGFVVLGYALYWARKAQAAVIENKGAFLWQKFPKSFLVFCSSRHSRPSAFSRSRKLPISRTCRAGPSLLTFAGVGLRTNIREMMKQGMRPFMVGAIGEFAIAGGHLADGRRGREMVRLLMANEITPCKLTATSCAPPLIH